MVKYKIITNACPERLQVLLNEFASKNSIISIQYQTMSSSIRYNIYEKYSVFIEYNTNKK